MSASPKSAMTHRTRHLSRSKVWKSLLPFTVVVLLASRVISFEG